MANASSQPGRAAEQAEVEVGKGQAGLEQGAEASGPEMLLTRGASDVSGIEDRGRCGGRCYELCAGERMRVTGPE